MTTVIDAYNRGMEAAAVIAQRFIIDGGEIHPDTAMALHVKQLAHHVCQCVAAEIRDQWEPDAPTDGDPLGQHREEWSTKAARYAAALEAIAVGEIPGDPNEPHSMLMVARKMALEALRDSDATLAEGIAQPPTKEPTP